MKPIDPSEFQGLVPNKLADSLSVETLAASGIKGKDNSDYHKMQRLLQIAKQYETLLASSGTSKWFVPGTPFEIDACPRHKAFFGAGDRYHERFFMASNRTGKSICGSFEVACHATGIYPDWWTGRRFYEPCSIWCVGPNARVVRDTMQKELLGPIGAWGTGMISTDKLGKWWALQGTPQAVDVIEVKHISGGMSTIGFKNYEQKLDAFYGTAKHVVWGDEEMPADIYNECLLRTMTTNGIMLLTFTPLAGLTPLVVKFCEKADFLAGASPITAPADADRGEEDARLANVNTAKAVIQAGWEHAPWLSEDAKRRMLEDTPPNLRLARSKGIPAMGSGNVYPMSFEELIVKPFPIPDYYDRLYALDVGWNVTACLWAARDPNTDIIYIYDEHRMEQQPPEVHIGTIRSKGAWIPGVIDPASAGSSQVDGRSLMAIYRAPANGLNMYPAKNEVEAGIANTWNRMTQGKLKFFSSLIHTPKEYIVYRRDLKGKVMKENDHLMDCLRYIVNNLIRAKSKAQATQPRGRTDGSIRYDL